MRRIDYSQEIGGLSVIEEFVSPEEEQKLLEAIDQQPWTGLGVGPNPEMKRRTQQYGHLFSYRYRKVLEELGPMPAFANGVIRRIAELQLMNPPNHLLINEYNAGQGIMPHIDAPALFGPVILSLSLSSACIMRFAHKDNDHVVDILLPQRSIAVLSGDARYLYKHSISKDLVETSSAGVTVQRDRRVSLTFREIIAWEVPSSE